MIEENCLRMFSTFYAKKQTDIFFILLKNSFEIPLDISEETIME